MSCRIKPLDKVVCGVVVCGVVIFGKAVFSNALVILLAANLLASHGTAASFVETFDGEPSAPTPWHAPQWDITVHSRDVDTWDQLEVIDAAHGPDCAAPPATHPTSSYEGAVYNCRNHVMTAINSSSYGLIYLTPNQQLDFSEGTASLKFDMSTLRSSTRDWIDVWITPYEDNLQLALDDWLPDLGGDPRRAIHIRMDNNNLFRGFVVDDFVKTQLPSTSDGWQGYDSFLEPSGTRRDTFELRVSDTHIQFGMPEYDFWWIDTDIASLGWDAGVVQLGHHSYNPTKCDGGDDCGNEPNSWHWDNVEMSSARPFTILSADRRYADRNTEGIAFDAPAPSEAHLRLAGIGENLEVSFDDGATWQTLELQSHRADLEAEEHFKSYWMPIPAGTTKVEFRGDDWFGGDWRVRDLSIWSLTLPTSSADFDNDGDIDGADFLAFQRTNPDVIPAWQSQYGDGESAIAASQSVPEPPTTATVLLVLVGMLAGPFRRLG